MRVYQMIRPFIAISMLVLAAVPASYAALVTVTYSVTAGDFADSNSNPPPPPATTFVSGTLTFTYDTALAGQTEITPVAVAGFDIIDRDGVLHDHDATNSGVNIALDTLNNWRRVTYGGNVSGVDTMVGISDDFRVQWDIDLATSEVIAVFENFTYNSTVDPFYTAGFTTVELVSATVVPIGPAAPLFLMGAAMLGLVSFRRKAG